MKIGLAAPISLALLSRYVEQGELLPEGYLFPSTATLVQEYLYRGHQVVVFTLDKSVSKPIMFKGENLTIYIGPYRSRARYRALDFFAVERSHLLNAMKNEPCDIIHAHWTYEFALATLKSGYPHLVTAHDAPLTILKFMPNPYRFIRMLMGFVCITKISNLSVPSPYLAEYFQKIHRFKNDIYIIPNCLPKEMFLNIKRAEPTRLTFASILNGWDRHKNSKGLIKAFSIVRKYFPEARLIMFGLGHGAQEQGAQWARENKLAEGVEFVGSTPYDQLIERLFKEVNILVHPALEESFCVAIAEAMALGIPVIGGENSGAVPWTMDNGAAGLLVDVCSSEKIAQAMILLGSDLSLQKNRVYQVFCVSGIHN